MKSCSNIAISTPNGDFILWIHFSIVTCQCVPYVRADDPNSVLVIQKGKDLSANIKI